jgi:hypothetical protein
MSHSDWSVSFIIYAICFLFLVFQEKSVRTNQLIMLFPFGYLFSFNKDSIKTKNHKKIGEIFT